MTDTQSGITEEECPECEGNLVKDDTKGEIVCENCGIVIDEDLIEEGPEWRSFNYDEEMEKSRTGSPTTQSMHDKGLTTDISWKDKDAKGQSISQEKKHTMKRLREAHKRSKTKDPKESNLRFALSEIDRLCSALDLPQKIIETASVIYRRALDEDLVRGRSIEGVVGASVYIACRKEGIPRSLSEIEKPSRVDETEIGRTYRYILGELDFGLEPIDPASYIPRFCSELDLSPLVEQTAISIVENTREAASGKSPTGFAAAAIYLAGVLSGEEKPTQKELADVADVTEVTVRNRYQEQDEVLDKKLDRMLETEDVELSDLAEGEVDITEF
jgi:transcription initiation factor TFIIB